MRNIVIIAILALSITSCGLVKPQIVYVNKDSLVVKTETIVKDSIIHIPGDTIKIQIPCNVDTVYIVRGKSSHSTVQVKKGVVTVQNNCDEKDIIITKLQDKVSKYESQVSDSSKTEIVQVKHVPAIYKVFAWGFWILAGLVTAVLLTNQNIWILVVAAISKAIQAMTKKKK